MWTFSFPHLKSKAAAPLLAGVALLVFASRAHADLPTLEWKSDLPEQNTQALVSWRFEEGDGQVDYVAPAGWTADGKFGGGLEIGISSDTTRNENFAKAKNQPPPVRSGSITVDLWIKPRLEAIPEGQAHAYLFDQMYVGNEGVQLYLSTKTRQLTAKVGNGENTLYARTRRIDFEPAQWVHVALSYHGESGTLRLFVDGVLAAEKVEAGFGALAPGSRAFRVGNRQGSIYMPLPCIIDNFRVTNEAARFEP